MEDVLLFVATFERGILMKSLFALILGLIIGYERERRGKQVGMRTISLVLITAMVFTHIGLDPIFALQPALISAQVVFGISFLGAGLIIKTPDGQLDNLTTAATIWMVAALGMVIGTGGYRVACVIAIIYMIIIMIPNLSPQRPTGPSKA